MFVSLGPLLAEAVGSGELAKKRETVNQYFQTAEYSEQLTNINMTALM